MSHCMATIEVKCYAYFRNVSYISLHILLTWFRTIYSGWCSILFIVEDLSMLTITSKELRNVVETFRTSPWAQRYLVPRHIQHSEPFTKEEEDNLFSQFRKLGMFSEVWILLNRKYKSDALSVKNELLFFRLIDATYNLFIRHQRPIKVCFAMYQHGKV